MHVSILWTTACFPLLKAWSTVWWDSWWMSFAVVSKWECTNIWRWADNITVNLADTVHFECFCYHYLCFCCLRRLLWTCRRTVKPRLRQKITLNNESPCSSADSSPCWPNPLHSSEMLGNVYKLFYYGICPCFVQKCVNIYHFLIVIGWVKDSDMTWRIVINTSTNYLSVSLEICARRTDYDFIQ